MFFKIGQVIGQVENAEIEDEEQLFANELVVIQKGKRW